MNDATNRDTLRDAEVHDVTGYDLTSDEVERIFADAQVPRSLRTIQRYCKSGYLDCKEYGTINGMMLRINQNSVERRIKEIQQIQATVDGRDASRQAAPSDTSAAASTQADDLVRERRQTTTDDDNEMRRDMPAEDLQSADIDDTQRHTTTAATRRDVSSSSVNNKLVDALVKQLDGKDANIAELKEWRRNDRRFFTHQLDQLQLKHRQEIGIMQEVLQPLIDHYIASKGRELGAASDRTELPNHTTEQADNAADSQPDRTPNEIQPQPRLDLND